MRSIGSKEFLALLDQAYDRRSWHGTNLKGSIRGLAPAQAAWRPKRGRHNIWEITVHAAYWKYAVWRRLTGNKRGSFPLSGSNWFTRPEAMSAQGWRRDVLLLEQMHRQLRETVASFPPAKLDARAPGSPFTFADLIRGAGAHDLYHAGQIQLLKRLQ